MERPLGKACGRAKIQGFTLIELTVVVAILGVLAAIAISYLYFARQRACEITAQHDLKQFVKAEEARFTDSNLFAGAAGQSIRGDSGASDFHLESFSASPGVVITVVSGDPADPFDEADPFVVQARHQNAPRIFEYNFVTTQFIER